MSAALQYESPDIDALLARMRELAVLPHVVYKVLEISGNDEASCREIETAIVVDPGFSSKLLTVANSAYYALPKKVTSIKEAILFLGFKSIRQIAMTVGLYDMFIGKTDTESMRRRQWWRHSVDTAVAGRWIARQSKRLNPEDAYTCGLIHLIGKTLLDRYGGKDYESVAALVKSGIPDILAEQQIYGCDHMQVAAAAAAKWGFPDQLVSGLRYLDPDSCSEEAAPIRACTCLGSLLASWVIEGAQDAEDEGEALMLPSWAVQCLGLGSETTDALLRGATAAISEAASMSVS